MKNFVIKWLEVITSIAFVLIVLAVTIAFFMTGPLERSFWGLIVGLLLGIMAGVLSTGLIFTLLSINEHLCQIQEHLSKKD